MRFKLAFVLAAFALFYTNAAAVYAADPLPSWNDGKTKSAIMRFVEEATKEKGTNFVLAAERIATFDNDGTLWLEQPLYVQLCLRWIA